MLIFGHDRAVARWVGDHLGVEDFGPCVAIGVAHKGVIVAGWVYNNYRPPNIEISFVRTSPNWASPGAIRAIFAYPFVQIGCKRLTATVEAKNQPVRAFLCRLGFRQEGYHPDALPTGDAVTYGILAQEAVRWTAEEGSPMWTQKRCNEWNALNREQKLALAQSELADTPQWVRELLKSQPVCADFDKGTGRWYFTHIDNIDMGEVNRRMAAGSA